MSKELLRRLLLEKYPDSIDAGIIWLAEQIPCSPIIVEAIVDYGHEVTPEMEIKLSKIFGSYYSENADRLSCLESRLDELG